MVSTPPKINYIIATHALTYKRRGVHDKYAKYALRYHMYILSKLLTSESYVTQVTIVKPDVVDEVGYYDISPYDKIIEDKGTKVEYFVVENKGISYTQYIKAFHKFTEFDYYIIMEDDWTINLKYTNFDKILLELYNNVFKDNIGFLNCWSPKGGFVGHPFHSAITLGILHKKSVDNLLNNLNNIESMHQLQFSLELLKRNIPIVDMNQSGFKTKVFFWITDSYLIRDYSEIEAEDAFFTPIQYYYDTTKYQIGLSDKHYILKQNFGIHNV